MVPMSNGRIVQLFKSLYVLRQAPKLWEYHFSKAVARIVIKRSISADCLLKYELSDTVYILMYVEYLLLFRSNKYVKSEKDKLEKLFMLTYLDQCSQFLGIEIERLPVGIFISHKYFTNKLIDFSKMHCWMYVLLYDCIAAWTHCFWLNFCMVAFLYDRKATQNNLVGRRPCQYSLYK